MRFRLYSPQAVGAAKIEWDVPVEVTPEIREGMKPHDVDRMHAGVLRRGFAVGSVTYPRETLAFRVADGHEIFLQLPLDERPAVAAPAAVELEAPGWTVTTDGTAERHRVVVGKPQEGERIDVIIASQVTSLSRAVTQRLIDAGQVTVGGQPIKKSNLRLHEGDVIEVVVAAPAS